jgi:hypothetical protein
MRTTTEKARSPVNAFNQGDISAVAKLNYPPLSEVTRSRVTTSEAAFYLSRRPRTLHVWACYGKGPITPIRVHGRLAWSADDIRKLVGEAA